MITTAKTCIKCSTEKPVEEFYKYKAPGGKTYTRRSCKVCFDERPSMSSESRKKVNLRHKYGLSWEAYQELVKDGCEVCGTHEKLVVDHDHSCCPGKETCGNCIRGILCDRHNRAEGMLRGNPDEAIALAAYMMRFVKEEVGSNNHN